MKKSTLVLLLCLGGSLLGCSSKPDVGAIEAQLKEGWGTCKGLKMTDIKKTNGVDHGGTYDMGVAYKLEITKDASAQDAWYNEAICPSPGMLKLLWAYGKLDNKFGQSLKTGDVINVNDVFTMVKSENGWISQ